MNNAADLKEHHFSFHDMLDETGSVATFQQDTDSHSTGKHGVDGRREVVERMLRNHVPDKVCGGKARLFKGSMALEIHEDRVRARKQAEKVDYDALKERASIIKARRDELAQSLQEEIELKQRREQQKVDAARTRFATLQRNLREGGRKPSSEPVSLPNAKPLTECPTEDVPQSGAALGVKGFTFVAVQRRVSS